MGTVIVTGASSGIGRAALRGLADSVRRELAGTGIGVAPSQARR